VQAKQHGLEKLRGKALSTVARYLKCGKLQKEAKHTMEALVSDTELMKEVLAAM